MSRDSPRNSNRNSGSSTSSGRVVGGPVMVQLDRDGNGMNLPVVQAERLSGHSYDSEASLRHSLHSASSSSHGSLDYPEDSSFISPLLNIAELFHAGWKDEDVMLSWLRAFHYDEYYYLFRQAGYDMATVSRMTPEDLTAIGVTKPGHRKKLKSEIARLRIHDGIPDYIPKDLHEWLHCLKLNEYHKILYEQGYCDIDSVTKITWEDLEDIGIKMLGHQKKIMLAIDRLKRLASRRTYQFSVEFGDPGDPGYSQAINAKCGDAQSPQYGHDVSIAVIKPKRFSESSPPGSGYELSTFQQHHNHDMSFTKEPSPKEQSPSEAAGHDLHHMHTTHDSAVFQGSDYVNVVKSKPIARIIAKTKLSSQDEDQRMNYCQLKDYKRGGSSERTTLTNNVPEIIRASSADREVVYDVPVTYPNYTGKPLVLLNPQYTTATTAAITPLYIQTSYDSTVPNSLSPNISCKKPAPLPPKRTYSMFKEPDLKDKTMSYVNSNESCSHVETTPLVDAVVVPQTRRQEKSAPPVAPKPISCSQSSDISVSTYSAVNTDKQMQSFSDSLRILSAKFRSNRAEKTCGINDIDSCHSSDSEEFPPPPPPLAMEIITPNYSILNKTTRDSVDYLSQTPFKQSPPKAFLNHNESDKCLSPVRASKIECLLNNDLTGSTTSVDSNTIPFANEDVGTIKQNALAMKVQTEDYRVIVSSDHNMDINSGFSQGRCSMLSFHQKPHVTYNSSVHTNKGSGQTALKPSTPIKAPCATVQPTICIINQKSLSTAKKSSEAADVLNDIDNMLEGLTNELDAMLVEEAL